MKYVTALIFLLFLSGCSTLGLPVQNGWSYNPQNYQGCTVAVYQEKDKSVTWHDCKDKSQVATTVDLNSDGKPDLVYNATDVVGSKAAQIRADVEKVFSENGAKVTPAIVEGVTKVLLNALGVPTTSIPNAVNSSGVGN